MAALRLWWRLCPGCPAGRFASHAFVQNVQHGAQYLFNRFGSPFGAVGPKLGRGQWGAPSPLGTVRATRGVSKRPIGSCGETWRGRRAR
jgi:hypothetical protein